MVLAICQHNAFINQIHALSIARTMGLPLLTVVLTATQQPSHQVNIRQLCQSFGVPAQQISRIEQLSDADAWSLLKQPMVLDVAVDASVRPPTGLQRQYQGSTAVPVADDRDS
jgi:thiamine pyrophosphate-dependent acetolactate synthase large subunit-like protein